MKKKNGILFLFVLFLFSCKNNSKHEVVYNFDSTIKSEVFHLPGNVDSEIEYDYFDDVDVFSAPVRIKGGPSITVTNRKNDTAQYCYMHWYDSTGAESLISFDNFTTGVDYSYEPKWGGSDEDNMDIEIGKTNRYSVIKEKGQLKCIIYERNFFETKKEGFTLSQHYDSLGQIDFIDIDKRCGKPKFETYSDTTINFETKEKKLAFKDTLLEHINKLKSNIVLPHEVLPRKK